MSSIGESDLSTTGAKAINALASDWLQRQHFWDWSESDQAAPDVWLAESLAHRTAYWRVRSAWERSERLTALRHPEPPAPAGKAPWIRQILKRAMVVLAIIGVLGGGAAVMLSAPRGTVYATPVGGHKIITLADGSQVELNTDTSLKVDLTANRRTVSLVRGEAYFQIIHDATRPFVVVVAGNRVTDIGTRFLVRNEANRVVVTLVEGRARFDAGTDAAQSKLLSVGDVLVAANKSISVTKKSTPEIEDHLGWRQGVLVFDHTTLADAAAEFNRYNRGKLVIATSAAARLTIDGTFPVNGVSAFTRVANAVFGLHVTARGEDTVISR